MPYKVLVVDDSTFFRRRVREILEQDPKLEVVGEAKNGQEAVQMVRELDPDVITMDVEMPIMDGITAVKEIMNQHPVPIIMFSSLTYEGAQATLDALEAGALDFLPKKFEDIARDRKEVIELLQSRVRALGLRKGTIGRFRRAPELAFTPGKTKATRTFIRSDSLADTGRDIFSSRHKRYQLLAIGTSTGGPVALQTILTEIPATFSYPIILVQHMPGTFTSAFAERLNQMCQIKVKEAADGDVLRPGVAYLAPGGKQMLVKGTPSNPRISITDSNIHDSMTYKPSVDLTFDSLADVYGGDVLGIILTGMGADGREGCRKLKDKGARIWAQDEQSCVVYGMPQAVAKANIAERSIALSEMADSIKREM
ncbi:chemotaxis response regulator protein-glutamate methylesterase [Paraneptunicella aestuarii]|uniref:protein-glutamate methylesterase/protein-glutamine glutaminase n=1 Tax=Paraneptunicella aestuarii TaxID=2831148 RepID=UPI001E42B75E|nr:chemotaxis response regulator protein-glutamate methylesterase [Paraneptunicella aestuarii]UAA38148.1 chemotaxis response regulator protein-glutamate methylesterase [Paraneptunicella aestuarii]